MNDTCSVIGFNGNIFVGTGSGYCYIIDFNNGKIIKEFNFSEDGARFNGYNASIDIESNLFYLTSGNNNLYISNILTKITNTVTLDIGNSSEYTEPISIGNSVYVSSMTHLYKIDVSYALPSNGNNNSPLVDKDQNIYIGTNSHGFYKFDKNLTFIAKFSPTPTPNFNGGSAVLSKNNHIYLNDWSNKILYCIDTNCVVQSSYDYTYYGLSFYSTPAIGSNNLIYLGTGMGLIAIGSI
jgi:outer membrane protein assembly factor BamB